MNNKIRRYIVSVRSKHITSYWVENKTVEDNFPVILEGKNKQDVKELAQAIVRDLGTYPEGFVFIIERFTETIQD